MTVRIRLHADTGAELDEHETVLRRVLAVDEPASRDFRNRHRGRGDNDGQDQRGLRRYLQSTGPRTDAAAAAGGPGDAAAMSPLAVAEGFKRGRDLAGEISTLRAADTDLERRPWFPLQAGDVVLMHLGADEFSPAFGETFVAVDDHTDIAGNAMLRQVSRTPSLDAGEPDPEYLLRYDTEAGCWALDAEFGEGLQPWRSNPELTDADALADARIWAAQHIQLVDDPDQLGYLQGREHDDGSVPWFLPLVAPGEQLSSFYELWFEAGPALLTVIRAGAIVHGRPTTTTTTTTTAAAAAPAAPRRSPAGDVAADSAGDVAADSTWAAQFEGTHGPGRHHQSPDTRAATPGHGGPVNAVSRAARVLWLLDRSFKAGLDADDDAQREALAQAQVVDAALVAEIQAGIAGGEVPDFQRDPRGWDRYYLAAQQRDCAQQRTAAPEEV